MQRIQKFWTLALPLVIYLPVIAGWVPFPSSVAEYSDILITHYPNALYIKQALRDFHAVPLWSPLIFSGYPFFANPLSGLWYIPGWLALLFPLPAGFGVTLALHALWGGMGCYWLLRREGVGHRPALWGALAFEVMPKISAHLGAGHVTLIYAVYWTPWLLLASRTRRKALASGIVVAAIFLADPRWIAYSGLTWLAYYLAHSHNEEFRGLVGVGKSIVIGSLLAGPLWVPMLRYVRRSTRWEMPAREIFKGSLTFSELTGGLFPSGGRSPESAFYVGGIVLALVVYSLATRQIREQSRFWWITGGVSGVFALGTTLPGFQYLARLPGFSLLRVPPRSLFIFNFAGVVLAAFALDYLSSHASRQGRVKLWVFGSGTGFIALLVGMGILLGGFALTLMWGIGSLTAGLFLILSPWAVNKQPWMWIAMFALVIADGTGAAFINVHFRKPQMPARSSVERWVAEQHDGYGDFRTYSPSYSMPQHLGAELGLEMADGVDPLHLRDYAAFMEIASGVPYQGYSETIPPYSGDPRETNRENKPDADYLSVLNVKYVLSAFRLSTPDLELVFESDDQFGYRVRSALPRAWVQTQSPQKTIMDLGVREVEINPAEITRWEPNRIHIEADGPGFLVLSEIAYPGWRVKINGVNGEWQTVYGILRGVEIGPGPHSIEFRFRPVSLYGGLILWLVGLGLAYRDYNKYG